MICIYDLYCFNYLFKDMTCEYINIIFLIYYCDYHSYLCLFITILFWNRYMILIPIKKVLGRWMKEIMRGNVSVNQFDRFLRG